MPGGCRAGLRLKSVKSLLFLTLQYRRNNSTHILFSHGCSRRQTKPSAKQILCHLSSDNSCPHFSPSFFKKPNKTTKVHHCFPKIFERFLIRIVEKWQRPSFRPSFRAFSHRNEKAVSQQRPSHCLTFGLNNYRFDFFILKLFLCPIVEKGDSRQLKFNSL